MSPPKLTSSAAPVSVFISYSHKDEDLQKELVAHLATLKRQRKIQTWHAGAIEAGAEWDVEIKQQLETAQVILLLISHHFIASDYCYDHTMQQAIERHHAGAAQVIPIILRPCDWQGAPFSKLQTLPQNAPPITQWPNPDAAFLNIIQAIRTAIKTLPLPPSAPPAPPSSPAPPLLPPLPPPPLLHLPPILHLHPPNLHRPRRRNHPPHPPPQRRLSSPHHPGHDRYWQNRPGGTGRRQPDGPRPHSNQLSPLLPLQSGRSQPHP